MECFLFLPSGKIGFILLPFFVPEEHAYSFPSWKAGKSDHPRGPSPCAIDMDLCLSWTQLRLQERVSQRTMSRRRLRGQRHPEMVLESRCVYVRGRREPVKLSAWIGRDRSSGKRTRRSRTRHPQGAVITSWSKASHVSIACRQQQSVPRTSKFDSTLTDVERPDHIC